MKCTPKRRFDFLQKLVDAYWVKWNRYYFPSLIIRNKWHAEKRNVLVGDIVLLQDSNSIREKWKMARVTKTFMGNDQEVRRVFIEYKNLSSNESPKVDKGKPFTVVERPVQKLVVLLPVDYEEE